jgi:CHAD domain-containing protein
VKPSHQENARGTTRYLREQVGRLFDNLSGARCGEEEPIHQIRVASRRLRVALPVVARKPEGRRVQRSLRRLRALTRLAGKGRDFDVCVALFEQKAPKMKIRPMVVGALRRRLQAARKLAHRTLANELADFDVTRLREDLDILVERGGEGMEEAGLRLGNAILVEERILKRERHARHPKALSLAPLCRRA